MAWLPAGLLLLLLCAGCEEDVNPVLGLDRSFTVFGILTPDLDTQWVRVFPITKRLEPESPSPIDATVRSIALSTGEVRVWRDTVIQARDGSYGHYFFSPFRAGFNQGYRIEVRRSDGSISRAEATVPPRSELELLTPSSNLPVLLPVLVRGAQPNLIRIEVDYHIQYNSFGDKATMRVIYDGKQVQVDKGWRIDLNLSADLVSMRDRLRTDQLFVASFGLGLLDITLRLIVADQQWTPPGNRFDPDVLVQPDVLSNVENGFGFIGAGYRLQASWLPADSVSQRAGFRPR